MSVSAQRKGTPGPLIAGGLLLVIGAVLLAQATSSASENGVTLGGPTLAPVIVTALWVVAAVAYLADQLRSRLRGPTAHAEPMRWRTPFLLLASLIGYALVLKYTVAGYVLATAVFVLLSARLLSTRRWREVLLRDLATAIGLSVGIYLIFTRLLGIVLPAGVLPI